MKNIITVLHFLWGVLLAVVGIFYVISERINEVVSGWLGIIVGFLVIYFTLSRLKSRGGKLLKKEDSIWKKIRCFLLMIALILLSLIFAFQLFRMYFENNYSINHTPPYQVETTWE